MLSWPVHHDGNCKKFTIYNTLGLFWYKTWLVYLHEYLSDSFESFERDNLLVLFTFFWLKFCQLYRNAKKKNNFQSLKPFNESAIDAGFRSGSEYTNLKKLVARHFVEKSNQPFHVHFYSIPWRNLAARATMDATHA